MRDVINKAVKGSPLSGKVGDMNIVTLRACGSGILQLRGMKERRPSECLSSGRGSGRS